MSYIYIELKSFKRIPDASGDGYEKICQRLADSPVDNCIIVRRRQEKGGISVKCARRNG